MNFNYLKIAWRVLQKHKIHTAINIVGLGLGFSISVLMMIYVYHQLSFDKFHSKSENIYRFTINGVMSDGKVISGALTAGDVARVVMEQVPEADLSCRVYNYGMNEVIIDEKRFTDDTVLWVDSTFFRIFDFKLIDGSVENVLQRTNTLVVSVSTARKYFSSLNIIGKILRLGGMDYEITGIVDNVPANSHLQFDMLASFHTLEQPENNNVKNNGISFPTYLLKKPEADGAIFSQKATYSADEFLNDIFSKFGITVSHSLQPLSKIYLHSNFGFDTVLKGDIKNVYIFSFLALVVILIAVFNFINLVTAQSEKRTREIGVRKVMGAGQKDMILQFIGESLLIAFFAFILSLVFNELLINPFSQLIDEKLRLEYWHNPLFLAFIIGFMILIGVVAGFYPALYLSRFNPVKVLKGIRISGGNVHFMRKVLVIFQFAISIFLVVSVLLLNKQVRYMKEKDLGFNREHVVTVKKLTPTIRRSYQSIRSELLQHPRILEVTASQSIPGEDRSLQNGYKKGDDAGSAIMMYENRVQPGYLETFGLRLIAGRDFDRELKTDSAAIILNETAVKKLGLVDPIGQEIYVWQHLGKVIGVVSDYNFMSLHNEIDPLALTIYQKNYNRISIRYANGDISEVMAHIKKVFGEVDPVYSFEYTFVDDIFARMYKKEERVNNLITAAAILAIIISFMGLYALTSFTISKRIKEIGIRRTLGASVQNILVLLFKDLSRWVIIGNIVAWPVAFYVVMKWIQNFAFQINIWESWYLFILSGMLAAMVGVMATLMQAVSAVKANPVESLKTE
jgi:putative ABC transport system permease protein